jgi:5-methylthioadenosine/S-adenosylhomocysteine deaminase
MLTSARIALAHQRSMDNAAFRANTGGIPETTTIPVREALSWVTIEGARMLGLQDRIGTIAPGKQADLVLIRAHDLNLWPVHDPVAAVVQANVGNIDSVMVAGSWRKRNGKLLYGGLERVRTELYNSGSRILSELGWRPDLKEASREQSTATQ